MILLLLLLSIFQMSKYVILLAIRLYDNVRETLINKKIILSGILQAFQFSGTLFYHPCI